MRIFHLKIVIIKFNFNKIFLSLIFQQSVEIDGN